MAVGGIQATVKMSLEVGAIGVGKEDLAGSEVEGTAGELFRGEGSQLGKRREFRKTEVWEESAIAKGSSGLMDLRI